MPQELYTQILDLGNLDVYLETESNDESYFSVKGLPPVLGYGKHFFTLSYKDPSDSPLLATNSTIVFEFVDANGTVVFSELADIEDVSGAATGYIWIKDDPLRTADNIFDGELTMYVVGELDADEVPNEFKNKRNLRSSFTFEIRKNAPNLSPIMFYDPNGVVNSASFFETNEEDTKPGYTRGYINVSSSFLQTQGGRVAFAELSYKETGSQSQDFTLLNTFPLENSQSVFEVTRSAAQGLNPISSRFKSPIPRSIRRDTPVIFRLRYLDENKTPAQYYDQNRLNQPVEITSSAIFINGTPMVIEREDNLLKGSMFTGQAVGKGFETSGKSSAFMKTVDYTGFISASTHVGKSGIMFFSGSVLTESGDNYQGVGLELVGDSESLFRFRSNPSVLDIKTREFFVGSSTQFISASGGQIEISSSHFHLEPSGDVSFSGSIDASSGRIGGFVISSSQIHSDVDGRRDLIMRSNGQISASSILLASSSFIVDPNNLTRFGSDGFGSFVMANSTGVSIQTTDFNLNTARFIISSSDVGVMAMGSTPPTAYNSGTGVYMDGDGNFLVGRSTGPRIQFDGFDTIISSSNFYLGSGDQFVSGSNGLIEISSSNFHLDADGNVIMQGQITADTGEIGGFSIGKGALSSTNFFISGAASGTELFISSSGFSVDAQGVVSASDLSLQGGSVGGLNVEDGVVSVGEILKLKDSGQITGSQVLFRGGKVGGFNIDAGSIRSSNGNDINLDATNKRFSINTPTFGATGIQLQFNGGTPRFHVGKTGGEGVIFDGTNVNLSSSAFNIGNSTNFISGSNGQLRIQSSGVTTLSGSGVNILTPQFFFGKASTSFVSGSNGNIEITSSNFHLDVDGTVKTRGEIRATSGTIGGFNIGTNLESSGGTLNLKGGSGQITGSTVLFTGGRISGSNLNIEVPTFFLGSDAQFVSGSNGNIEITSSNFHLDKDGTVKTRGEITATSGKIAGWTISGDTLVGNNATLDGAGAALFRSDAGPDTDNSAAFDILRDEYYIDFSPSDQGNTKNYYVKFGPNFAVDSDGVLHASGAQFEGTVSASKGIIGGFTTDGSSFSDNNGQLFISGSPAVGGAHHPKHMFISSSNFNLKQSGDVTGSRVLFTGGTIGGFELNSTQINSTNDNLILKSSGHITGSQALFTGGKVGGWVMTDSTLTGGVVTLNSAGSIEVGGLANATTTATTNSGFFADSSGNVLIKGNVSNNDYLKVSAGGGIDIRTQTFDLDAGTLILDSATNSGKIALGATPPTSITTNKGFYADGTGKVLIGDADGSRISFNGTDLVMSASRFFLGGEHAFVSGAAGNIEISSSNFHLDRDGNVVMSGEIQASSGTIGGFTIGTDLSSTAGTLKLKGATGQITASDAQITGKVTATSGQIAGFTIDGNTLTATNFTLDASGKRIALGTGTNIFIADGDEGIQLGNSTFGLAPFSVTKAGVLKATAGTVGGYGISSTTISSSNNNLILRNSGQITGSTVLFTGGKIGGFTIDADEIKSENLLLDSTNEKITVGSSNAITIQGGGTDNFIVMGSKSAFAQTSTAGVILGMDNNVPSFDMTRNATNYMRFDTSTGVDIKTDTFKLDTTNLDIDSSTSRVQVHNGSNEVVRLGEISDSASDLYGLKIYDGSGTADSNVLVKLGGEGNTIGGWTITNNQIQSDNLVIHSSGRLETADFASGVKGWRISSEGNGEAEFENATIRGTLSTAVFEKETVNAVGGQLYVANSTALTGSGQISASFNTMSVVNVSGFVQNEILSLKKVTETGFTTEYLLVNSSSRDDKSSDTNFAGKLFVTRSYGAGTTGASGSLGGSPGNAQSYDPGQVVVSTGRVGTGYIRLNANPSDQATPFMDIVERTGTGVYDVGLKVRVGDLSGLSSATLFGNSDPGFGIFTENGFFKGGINATTGSFTGVVHINTSVSEVMKLGTNVSGTDDGIHINNNNYWYTDSQFKVGDANSFILHDGAGDIKIVSENFTLKGGSKLLMTTQSLAFDTSNATTATKTTGTGIFMSSSGDFRVGNASGNRLTFSGTSLELVTSDLNIDTSTFDLSTDSNGKIALGATPPTAHNSGIGVFMDGAGNFLAGNASGNHIKFDASSGAVNVAGTITISAGSDISAGLPAGTVSGSAQLADQISGSSAAAVAGSVASASAAQSTANTANTAAGNAQSTANTANSTANSAVSTANTAAATATAASASAAEASSSAVTATAAASTAQSAIDDMETQVVLSSGGMDLKKTNGTKLATFGTTQKFFNGTGDTDADVKLRLNTDGVFAFANTTESFARFYNQGVQIVSGGIERAKFAATTTIGNPSFEHVEITETSLKLKDDTTTRLSMDSSGMQIGSVGNGITLNSSGDATFNGAITIGAGLAASISGSSADAVAGSVSSASAANTAATNAQNSANTAQNTANEGSASASEMATQVVLDANGMSLKSLDQTKTLASFGTTVTIGENANNKSRVFIDDDSVDLIIDSSGTDTTFASFGGTTTVGATSAEHVSISSTGLTLKDNTTVVGKFNTHGATLGKTTGGHISASTTDVHIIQDANNKAVVDASGLTVTEGGNNVATFGSTARLGQTSAEHVLVDSTGLTIKDSSTVVGKFNSNGATIGKTAGGHISASTSAVHIIQDANNKAVVDASGLTITEGGNQVAQFAATSVIGSSTDKVTISDSGLTLRENNVNTLNIASGVIDVGDTSNEHLRIDTTGLTLKDNTTVVGKFNTHGATLGKTAGGHISASTTDVNIIRNANNKAVVNADGLTITQGGNNVATFGSTARLGQTSAEHVLVDSTGLTIKDASVVVGRFNTNGATLGKTAGGHISASTTDVNIIQDSTHKAIVNSSGLKIHSGHATNTVAEFGSTTFIGLQATEHVKITNSSFEIKDGGTTLGSFGATTTIGSTSSDHISIDSDSVDIIHDASNKAILTSAGLVISQSGGGVAEFAGTTRIGNRATEHVEITSTSLKLKDATTDLVTVSGTTVTIGSDSDNRVQITPSSMQIGSTGGGITMDSNGDATFNGTITIGASLASAISGSSNSAIAGATDSASAAQTSANTANATATTLTNASSSMAAAVQLTSTGMNILNSSSQTIAEYGADATIGRTDVGISNVKIDSDGQIDIRRGTKVSASFGPTTTIGPTSADHIVLDTSGLTIKEDTTVVGKFNTNGATLGKTTGAHVSASTTDVHIIQDANNKAVVDASGLKVIEGGNTVAQFAATTVIGSSTDKVTVSSAGVTIREGNVNGIQLRNGQVIVGDTDSDKIHTRIVDTGFIVSSSEDGNEGEVARFGETTTIGRTDSDHVRISSNSVSIKTDANTTVLSASAAGLAMSGRVTAASGEIGGFNIGASELSIGNVFITSSLGGQAGLVIKDGVGDNILTVVSQSGGQTPINDLTGSVASAGGGIDTNLLDFGFELGSNNQEVDDDSDSLWTIAQTDGGGGSAIGHWTRSGSADFVLEGSLAAVCPQFTINATDLANRPTMLSSMARVFPSKTGVLATFSAVSFAKGFVKFGDRGKMRASMTMTLEGSAASNMSSAETIGSRRITSLNSRPTTLKLSWKNTYAYVRATFEVSITPGFTKASSIQTGNFIVDRLKYSALNATLPAGFKETRVKPLVELSQDGLLIFSNPKEFLRVNDEGFKLKGDIDSVNLSVEADAIVTGSMKVLGETTFSGSLKIENSIPLGLGVDQPSSKLHVESDLSNESDYIVGDPPLWRWEKQQMGMRSTVIPLTSTDQNWVAASYGTDLLHDGYRINTSIVYGEQYTGQLRGFAGTDFDMSQSVALGHVRSFSDHKDQQGLRVYQNVGPLHTNQGDMRRYGAEITQFANITDTSGDDYTEMGIFIKQQGAFSQNPRNLDSDSRGRDEYSAAYGAANQRTGTYRNSNWGLALSGSGWPSWIGGKLGVGDRMENPSCTLDVNGTIQASADVVAFYSSDERLKTNIRTIKEPIYKLRQLKGVEYEWNDKQEIYPSGSLDSGIIAQDVQKVLPQLVKEKKDGYLGVRHDRLVGLLVEAIKDQQDQIDEMKDQIEELKNGSS